MKPNSPLQCRLVELAFRQLRDVSWFIGDDSSIDAGVAWLRDYSAWFKSESGIAFGHDLHLLYGRRVSLFFQTPDGACEIAPLLPGLHDDGYAIAAYAPWPDSYAYLAALEPVSDRVGAVVLDLTRMCSVTETEELLRHPMLSGKDLTVICPPELLLSPRLNGEAFGGRYITFVPQKIATDGWATASATGRVPAVVVEANDDVSFSTHTIGRTSEFSGSAMVALVQRLMQQTMEKASMPERSCASRNPVASA